MQFGSLPTGVFKGDAWQTLLFCPNPAAVEGSTDILNASAHKGFEEPRDHLLLDLFWMPVAEPYAISDPFSTAGKVNLNTELVPFPYITRDTALHGLLKSVKITAIPQAQFWNYKAADLGTTANNNYRYEVDITKTVNEIKRHGSAPARFLSPSEITEVFLFPKRGTGNALSTSANSANSLANGFWQQAKLTGDNLRERPYAAIYPRVTTTSNTFRIHYRVEVLKKRPGNAPDVWQEGMDRMTASRRGSILIERFIDPNDPRFDKPGNQFTSVAQTDPDYSLNPFYQFRVLESRLFRP